MNLIFLRNQNQYLEMFSILQQLLCWFLSLPFDKAKEYQKQCLETLAGKECRYLSWICLFYWASFILNYIKPFFKNPFFYQCKFNLCYANTEDWVNLNAKFDITFCRKFCLLSKTFRLYIFHRFCLWRTL